MGELLRLKLDRLTYFGDETPSGYRYFDANGIEPMFPFGYGLSYTTQAPTPDTKLFSGFPDGRSIALGEVSLKIRPTRLNWATVSLVSRFVGGGFGGNDKPARILLAATSKTRCFALDPTPTATASKKCRSRKLPPVPASSSGRNIKRSGMS